MFSELQRKRSDKGGRVSCYIIVLQLIELFLEKYLKKLIGTTDIEDALKRLDRLTQEEARMAAAQVLNVANTVDDRVQGIADNVLSVDNKVAGIDDRVADVGDRLKEINDQVKGVNDQVTGVDDRVKDVNDQVKGVNDSVRDVDDRVKAVDDKIAAVADGAQCIFNLSSENWFNNCARRWKRGQGRHAASSR